MRMKLKKNIEFYLNLKVVQQVSWFDPELKFLSV